VKLDTSANLFDRREQKKLRRTDLLSASCLSGQEAETEAKKQVVVRLGPVDREMVEEKRRGEERLGG